MRIGLMVGAGGDEYSGFNGLIDLACRAEGMGFDDFWMANVFSYDAITALSVAGRETNTLGLGTAVVPSYPRHPTALAQQALTANLACDGRFTLGLGLSHKMVIEDMMGLSYAKPASHMREYLEVLVPLLKGEAVAYAGEEYQVAYKLALEESAAPSLVVAALGPRMLKIAGELSDGTTTWMVGPKTLREHIIPRISESAAAVGKPAPRIVAGLPIALTNNVEAAKKQINNDLQIYGQLPSYRAMLDREGAANPADIAIIGDEAHLKQQLDTFKALGVTDFNAAVIGVEPGAYKSTMDFLAAYKNS